MGLKTATIVQVQGVTFIAKSSTEHWVVMDGPEGLQGSEAAPRPKDMLLFALGGCTASDVVSILHKKRVPVGRFEVHLEAHVREEHPQVFTDIAIEYVLYGDGLRIQDVEHAIELSATKYCSVSAMLKPAVPITYSYRIESLTETFSKDLEFEHAEPPVSGVLAD